MPSGVLVLDAGYRMTNVVCWQKALTLVMTNKAEVLEEGSRKVRTVRMEIPVPTVIRLVHSVLVNKENKVKFSRANVLKRDNFQCQYCGIKMPPKELTLEHIVPRAQGGKTEWINIVVACSDCNRKKADRTPEQANMKLMRKPRVPTLVPYIVVETEDTSTWKKWVPHLKYMEKED